MTTRIAPGVGANLLGQHSAERNQDATAYVGNLDPQVRFPFQSSCSYFPPSRPPPMIPFLSTNRWTLTHIMHTYLNYLFRVNTSNWISCVLLLPDIWGVIMGAICSGRSSWYVSFSLYFKSCISINVNFPLCVFLDNSGLDINFFSFRLFKLMSMFRRTEWPISIKVMDLLSSGVKKMLTM